MKSPRFWLLMVTTVALVLAVRPAAQFFLQREVQQRTGMRISMGKCRVNPLNGTIYVEDAKVECARSAATSGTSNLSRIEIGRLWTRQSLPDLMHGRWVAPVSLVDGYRDELLPADRAVVPRVHPITAPPAPPPPLHIEIPHHPALVELDRVRDQILQSYAADQSSLHTIGQRLTELDQRSIRFDNPLRDRDLIRESQLAVTSMRNDIGTIQASLLQPDALNAASESILKNIGSNSLLLGLDASPESLAVDAKWGNEARRLAEQWICSTVESIEHHLAFTASMSKRWLIGEYSRSQSPMMNPEVIVLRTQRAGLVTISDRPTRKIPCLHQFASAGRWYGMTNRIPLAAS